MSALAIIDTSYLVPPPRDDIVIHAEAQEDGLGFCFYQGRRYVFSFAERSLKRVRVGDQIVFADMWSPGLAVGELLGLDGLEAMVKGPDVRLPIGDPVPSQRRVAIVGVVIFEGSDELN